MSERIAPQSHCCESSRLRTPRVRLPGRAGMLLAFCAATFAGTVSAYTFVPQDHEWASWPPFCRARYVTLTLEESARRAVEVPATEVALWEAKLGPAFQHVHHYCAGLAYANQASAEFDKQTKSFLWSSVVNEAKYTWEHIGPSHLLSPDVSALLAEGLYQSGHPQDAQDLLRKVLVAQPSAERPYVSLALIARRMGNLKGAVEMLEQGNVATQFNSAEINYNLGLYYLELGRFDDARECAARAYSLGYPLPGLKKKLMALGQSKQKPRKDESNP
jgi:tetratricopeptide (TPR) repeat protein